MALKFEVMGNNLVVTDTADSSVKLERPVGDIYGICEANQFKILTRTGRNDQLLIGDYSSLQNSAGAVLDKAGLTTFFRTNLGFSKAGSTASQTNPNIATWFGGSTLQTSNFQSSFGGIGQAADGFGTSHMVREMPAHYDALRLIFANGSSAFDIHIAGAVGHNPDSAADVSYNDAFATAPAFTFNGQPGGIVPKRDASVTGNGPNLAMTDWLELKSQERSDVIGALPLFAARVVFDGRKAVTLTGGGRGDPFSSWARGGSDWDVGGRANKLWTCRPWGNQLRTALSGSFSTPQLATTDTGQASLLSIFGIQYRSRNQIVTIFGTGDSIRSNDYGSVRDRGYPPLAAAVQNVSTLARPIEYCNMGIAAQTSKTFTDYAIFALGLFKPSHVLHSGYTPNDITIGVGTPAALQQQLDGMDTNTARMKAAAEALGAKFLLENGVPRNASGSQTNSYFDATNGLIILKYKSGLASRGVPMLDIDSSVANKTQLVPRWQSTAAGDAADLTSDQIHPNIAARLLMYVPTQAFVTRIRDASLPI